MGEGKGSWGADEAMWNPGTRRRGSRGELQGPCNHCFATGAILCISVQTASACAVTALLQVSSLLLRTGHCYARTSEYKSNSPLPQACLCPMMCSASGSLRMWSSCSVISCAFAVQIHLSGARAQAASLCCAMLVAPASCAPALLARFVPSSCLPTCLTPSLVIIKV